MFTIDSLELSELSRIIRKLPIHTLRGRIYDLLGVDRKGCKKKTNKMLKALARGFGVNDNANFREFWEILYIHFSRIAISKKQYNFFNPCRDEPPEIKRKLSPTRIESDKKYYGSSKGKKNLLKSVKAYKQRNKKP